MKKLVLFFLVLSVLCFTACADRDVEQEAPDTSVQQEDTTPPKSKCDGGVYTNSFAGISFTLPEDFSFYSEEAYKTIVNDYDDGKTYFDSFAFNDDGTAFLICDYVHYSLSQDHYANRLQVDFRSVEYEECDIKLSYIETISLADNGFSKFIVTFDFYESDRASYRSFYMFKVGDYILRFSIIQDSEDFSWFEESITKTVSIV